MSLEGRISVDVLFHDKDGTAALKVVSLRETQQYEQNQKVVFLTGTANTTGVTIQPGATSYRNAAGQTVALTITRLLFQSPTAATCTFQDSDATSTAGGGSTHLFSRDSMIAVTTFGSQDFSGSFTIRATSDGSPSTCSWVIVLAGNQI